MDLSARLSDITRQRYGLDAAQCDDTQRYHALLQLTQELCAARPAPQGKRKLYYFSAEFLLGKLLSNNLLALGLYEQVDSLLRQWGSSLAAVEEAEPEPSLGNGGLGRLAACFLDLSLIHI